MRRDPARFVDELDVELEERRIKSGAPDLEMRKKLAVMVRECGWKKRSQQRMSELQGALETRNIYVSEDLSDLSFPVDTFVRFRRGPFRSTGMLFAREKDFERFLAKNHKRVFADVPGLFGATHVGGGTLPQVRYPFGKGYVRPDLVFRSTDGFHVVVEVKLDPDDRGVQQLRKYLSAAAKRHDGVRGLYITAQPRSQADESATREAIRALPREYDVQWLQYEAEMVLRQVS